MSSEKNSICIYWLNGNCKMESACQYMHPEIGDAKIPRCRNGSNCDKIGCNYNHVICKHFVQNNCKRGDKCHFQHDNEPENKTKFRCHNGFSCSNKSCKYNHMICLNWIQHHHCKFGQDCKNQHPMLHDILIHINNLTDDRKEKTYTLTDNIFKDNLAKYGFELAK